MVEHDRDEYGRRGDQCGNQGLGTECEGDDDGGDRGGGIGRWRSVGDGMRCG